MFLSLGHFPIPQLKFYADAILMQLAKIFNKYLKKLLVNENATKAPSEIHLVAYRCRRYSLARLQALAISVIRTLSC